MFAIISTQERCSSVHLYHHLFCRGGFML